MRVSRNTNDDHLGFAIDHTKQANVQKRIESLLYVYLFGIWNFFIQDRFVYFCCLGFGGDSPFSG